VLKEKKVIVGGSYIKKKKPQAVGNQLKRKRCRGLILKSASKEAIHIQRTLKEKRKNKPGWGERRGTGRCGGGGGFLWTSPRKKKKNWGGPTKGPTPVSKKKKKGDDGWKGKTKKH